MFPINLISIYIIFNIKKTLFKCITNDTLNLRFHNFYGNEDIIKTSIYLSHWFSGFKGIFII